jgi:hypothetical protein
MKGAGDGIVIGIAVFLALFLFVRALPSIFGFFDWLVGAR